jgi:endoglucanase
VYHKLTTKRFGGFVMPEAETAERYFTPWGSEATAQFVGMMGQASRVFRPYDKAFADYCLQAARRSYLFLRAHPGHHKPDQSEFRTGPYEIDATKETSHRLNGVPNNRLWAEAEVWEATGNPIMLRELEEHIKAIGGQVNFTFDWDEVKDLGLITYLSSKHPGRDPALVGLVRLSLIAVADEMVRASASDPYGSPAGTNYCWGYNGFVARQALVLMTADRIAREQGKSGGSAGTPYRAVCLEALNFLFGHNYYGRSFVTGIGFRPPMHPHDRRSAADKVADPWPGYLVGGAQPKATSWRDAQEDAGTNEIAINWNAALIYALAACLEDGR